MWKDLMRGDRGAIVGNVLKYKVVPHKRSKFNTELRIECPAGFRLHTVTEYDPEGKTSVVFMWTTEE